MLNEMVHYNICDICRVCSAYLVPLGNIQQLLLHVNLQMKLIPDTACEICYMQLHNFIEKLSTAHKSHKQDMHSEPTDLSVKQAKQEDDDEEEEEEEEKREKHAYNCDCEDCKRKYGYLPLLAEVIDGQINDQRSNNESPTPSTSSAGSSKRRNQMRCEDCGKTFSHRGDMNKHLRKHSGEQPFACHVCDKKFAHTSNLARHLKVHSGEKPFICNVCEKPFSRKDKLQLHQKSKLCRKRSEEQTE